MTLILETGTGVQKANSYVTAAFVTSYLTERGRQTENGWDALSAADQDAKCIAATQYLDARFGGLVKGSKQVYFDGQEAQAVIEFTGQPANTDTITVGSQTYTFLLTEPLLPFNTIIIGADAEATARAFIEKVGTIGNDSDSFEVEAAFYTGSTSQVLLTQGTEGESGNDTPLSTTSSSIDITLPFQNGLDAGSQPLEFPRAGAYDRAGVIIRGVPRGVKWACAEYAVRAVSAELFQDPTVEASGRMVKREKLGPLETEYIDSGALDLLVRPYPAADRMMSPFLKATGGVIR